MMQFRQIYNYSTSVFAFGILLASFSICYALFYETPWMYYKNSIFETEGRNYFYTGEIVPLKLERCSSSKTTEYYSISHSLKSIDNNSYYVLPEAYVSIEPGCTIITSNINRLPLDLPSGKYIIFGAAHIKGLIKNYDIKWSSVEFTVLEK